MDVRLPDGTVISNVPDSMSKAEFTALARSKGYNLDSNESGAETSRLARSGTPGAYDRNPVTGLDPTAQAYRLNRRDQPPGVLEQGYGGAKHAWDRVAMGAKDIFTDLTPEDRDLLARGKAFVDQTGPASTVGQIAGDIGMSAAPIFRIGNYVSSLPLAIKALGRAAPVTASVAANAGYGALSSPEDRATGAMLGGGGAVAGNVLVNTLGGLSKHVIPRYRPPVNLAEDIIPTAGIAGQTVPTVGNRVIGELENQLGRIPVARASLTGMRERYNEALKKAKTAEASDPVAPFLDPAQRQLPSGGFEFAPAKVVRPDTLGSAGLALGTLLHAPMAGAAVAGMIALYSKPVQQTILGLMKHNDSLASFLERNPGYQRLFELGAARYANEQQQE